jgi:VanZ family protein
VAVWTFLIYSAIPFARPFQSTITALLGRQFFVYFTVAGTTAAAIVAIVYIVRHPALRSKRSVFWLCSVVAVFIYLCLHRLQTPQEAIHFLEYGFLGLIAFRAISHRIRDPMAYVCAVLLCSIIGNLDEILQWLTPRRYWDLRDWAWNTLAAILAQIAIAGGMRPPYVGGPITPSSVRHACRLATLQALVLAFCLCNTPVVVEWYAARIPFLGYLKTGDKVMVEYGYRHEDPDIGTFFSRFTIEDLRGVDAERAESAAAVLKEFASPDRYDAFLDIYSAGQDPFLHEARVHLFRRDHYHAVAWKHEPKPEVYRHHLNVAYRENQILAKYFPATMQAYGDLYSGDTLARLKAGAEGQKPYRSPVSAHMITEVNEAEIWAILAAVLAVLLLIQRRWGREPAPAGAPC